MWCAIKFGAEVYATKSFLFKIMGLILIKIMTHKCDPHPSLQLVTPKLVRNQTHQTKRSYFFKLEIAGGAGELSFWRQAIAKYENQDFIIQAAMDKTNFYSWVNILAGKELADKYVCEITVSDLDMASKVRELYYTDYANLVSFSCKLCKYKFYELSSRKQYLT